MTRALVGLALGGFVMGGFGMGGFGMGGFTMGETRQLTQGQWYLLLGTVIALIGVVRMLLTRDLVARLIALNVTGIGSLMILLALATRATEAPTEPAVATGDVAGGTTAGAAGAAAEGAAEATGIDPVLSALVITGLVITVAFTGLGAVLIRRIEGSSGSEAGR